MVLGPWIQKNVSKRLVTMIGIVCQPCKDYGCFRLNHTMNPRYKFSSRKHVAAAAAKSLHSCPTLCDPIRRQPTRLPLSLGFSRQEYWSGLPFPSPMYENEKWKWSRSVLSDSLRPHGLQPTRLVHPWDFPGKRTGVGCHGLLRPFILNWSNSLKNFMGFPCTRLQSISLQKIYTNNYF